MQISGASYERINELIYLFQFVINAFMSFSSFFFVCLLPSFINERSHKTLSVFKECVIQLILKTRVWLYGIEIVFWLNLTDFFVFVYLLFFL